MKATEIIESIGKQWPFLITLFLIIVFILKWKTIWNFISCVSVKIKRGDTEIELNKDNLKDDQTVKKEDVVQTKTDIPEDHSSNKTEDTLFGCYLKLSDNKLSEAESIFNQIQSKADIQDKIENEFIFYFYKYINGFSVEQEFKAKINQDIPLELRAIGYKYLGLSYKNTKQFDKAIDSFNNAIQNTKKESEVCNNVINISQTYLDNNDYNESKAVIIKYIQTIKEDLNKADLYYQLSKVYEAIKDKIMKVAALEKAVSLKGNNISYLFDTAFTYAETDLRDASTYHYRNLISIDSNHNGALNNLGVNFQNQKLTLKSVEYYKKATNKGNSLAAANLAYLYLNAGFEEEASKLFKEFVDKPDVNMNLINAQSSLVTEKEKQKKQAEAMLESGQKFSKFFSSFATKYFEFFEVKNQNIDDWIDEHGNIISISINDSEIRIKWEKANSKIGDNDIYLISGKLNNSASIINFDYPVLKEPSSWDLVLDKNKKPTREIKRYNGYCFVDLKNSKIEVLYKYEENYKFIKIFKKPSA